MNIYGVKISKFAKKKVTENLKKCNPNPIERDKLHFM